MTEYNIILESYLIPAFESSEHVEDSCIISSNISRSAASLSVVSNSENKKLSISDIDDIDQQVQMTKGFIKLIQKSFNNIKNGLINNSISESEKEQIFNKLHKITTSPSINHRIDNVESIVIHGKSHNTELLKVSKVFLNLFNSIRKFVQTNM